MIYTTSVSRLSPAIMRRRILEIVIALALCGLGYLAYKDNTTSEMRGPLQFTLYLIGGSIMLQAGGLALMNLFSIFGHFSLPKPKPPEQMTIQDRAKVWENLAGANPKSSGLPVIQFIGLIGIALGLMSIPAIGLEETQSRIEIVIVVIVLLLFILFWIFYGKRRFDGKM